MNQARLAAGWLKQKSKLLPVLTILILVGTLVLPIFAQKVSAADPNGCTYTYSSDSSTVKRTNCSGGVSNATFKKATSNPPFAFRYTLTEGSCGPINVSVRDASDPTTAELSGRLKSSAGCRNISTTSVTVANGSVTSGTGSTGSSESSDTTIDPCNATGINLSWVICPVINVISGGVTVMQNGINHLMLIESTSIFDTNTASGKAYFTAWNSFRLFGIALIIIAGLVMVISQSLGLEVFDAYTVRKIVPRLMIAAIGISLSWYLLRFFVDLTNDLGIAIRSIIYWPFRNLAGGAGIQDLGSSLLLSVVGAGAFLFLGLGGVLSMIATAGLAALIAFLVLVIRQILIVFLILLAPLAIACYVLPNTQKAYDLWWDSLSKALMMFPIISAFIAVGQVFSAVASSNPSGDFDISKIVAIIAFFLPYFALPFTFRLAGGAIATIGGLANDRSRGTFDRLKKYRGGKIAQNAQAMAQGNRFRGDGKLSTAFNRTTSGAYAAATADKGGITNVAGWKSAIQSHVSNQSLLHAGEYAEKNEAFQAIKNNDDLLLAGLSRKGNYAAIQSDLQAKGYSKDAAIQGANAVRLARRDTNDEVFENAAALSLPATGTAFKGGAGEMHKLINDVAGDDRQKASRLLASMRSGATQARRFDLGGGSYASQLGVMEDQYRGKISEADANKTITEQSLKGQGGGYIAASRNGAIKNFAPIMLDNIKTAAASGDTTRTAHELAILAGRYDAMGSVAPENADLLGHEVLSKELSYMSPVANGAGQITHYEQKTATVRQAIEDWRGTADFQNLRREYQSAAIAGASAAAVASNPQANPNPPTMGPPMGPMA